MRRFPLYPIGAVIVAIVLLPLIYYGILFIPYLTYSTLSLIEHASVQELVVGSFTICVALGAAKDFLLVHQEIQNENRRRNGKE